MGRKCKKLARILALCLALVLGLSSIGLDGIQAYATELNQTENMESVIAEEESILEESQTDVFEEDFMAESDSENITAEDTQGETTAVDMEGVIEEDTEDTLEDVEGEDSAEEEAEDETLVVVEEKAIKKSYAVDLNNEEININRPVSGAVVVELDDNYLKIGNNNISRVFRIDNNKLRTGKIFNWRGDSTFTPAEGSEEFAIYVLGDDVNLTPQQPTQDFLNTSVKSGEQWTMTGNSVSTNGTDAGGYGALIDGDGDTFYHSRYNNAGEGVQALPVELTLDRGTGTLSAVNTLGYQPRKGGGNGTINTFEVYAADSSEGLYNSDNIVELGHGDSAGSFRYVGNMLQNNQVSAWQYVSLKEPCEKRYIGIKVLSASGGSFASGAGIDFFAEKFDTFDIPNGSKAAEIKASDLTIQSIVESNMEDVKGKLIAIVFDDVAWGTGEASIVLKITMDNDSHYMRKWVEIKLAGESPDRTKRIAYIDGEHLYTTPSADDLNKARPSNSDTSKDIIWTIPPDSGAITNVNEARADLGQPVYINGLFLGSEFPAAENKILKNNERIRGAEGDFAPTGTRLAYARYYTGKNFADFERDTNVDKVTDQLNEAGWYVCWPTVVGASRTNGTKQSVVQQDFYAYIREIATPSNFRIQYNVWYDGMQRITDDSVMKSFQDMEKAMSSTGVRPLDAYIIDDGWQQTRLTPGTNPQNVGYIGPDDGSPLSINRSGFWDWNNKFPYKFFRISGEMLNRGSNTGIWMSPRGGYASANPLREVIVNAGNGSSAYGDSGVDCADTRYVKKFTEYAKEMTRDYGINYWKWDAFLTDGVFNHANFGRADLNTASYYENNQHMVGGPNQIYFYTDMWEKWIGIMQSIRDYAKTVDSVDNVWISNTCYINLSPWFLQWNNSVWLQCQGDRGMVRNLLYPNDQMNGMLTYRDAIYYDFINNHQFQFPLTNIFNHDPIYAPTDTGITANSMDGDKFRNYLYMLGTRGTAMYELQYSKSIFNDEKYAVNADFLEWEEGNFDTIKNAIMIGGTPDSGMGINVNGGSANATNGGKMAENQYSYGFSCFNGDEGIISMRNPDDADSVLTFTLNDEIGVVSSDNNEYHMWLDHYYLTNKATEQLATFSINDQGNFSPLATNNKLQYGQKITVNLKPGETQIWHLSKSGDTVKPYIGEVYFTADNKIKVKTSEHVRQQGNESISFAITTVNESDGTSNTFTVSNENITAFADMRTFELSLGTLLQDGQTVTVKMLNACDYSGNAIDDTGFTKKYYDNNTIVKRAKASSISGIVSSASRSIEGKQGFSVSIDLQYKGEAKLLSQGDSYSLGIDSEGKPYFTVFGVTAKAKEALKSDQECTLIGVRENNGSVRIYVDGDVKDTGYDLSTINREIKKADIKYSFGSNMVTALKICDTALAYDEMPESNLAKLIAMVEAADKSQFTTESWNSANIDALLIQAKEAEALHNNEKATEIYEQLKNAFYSLEIGEGQAINVLSGLAGTVALVDSNASTSGFEFVNAQRPITNITDGNTTLDNYTQFGKENENVPAYLQYDLGRRVELDSAKLWRYWDQGRQYTETALVVSESENFDKIDVLFYSGGTPGTEVTTDTYQLKSKLKEGKKLQYTNSLYQESANGTELYRKSGEETISARYVRLYVQGYNASGSGHMNHIIELQLFGTAKDAFGTEELEAIIREAEEKLESGDYSEEEAATLRGLIESAQKYLGENAEAPSSLGDIKSLVDSISNAIKNLPDKSIVDPDPTPDNPDPGPDNPDPKPEDPKPSDAVPEHFEPVIRNPHTDETDVEEGERIEYDTDYHYTGQAITPAVEIWDNGVKLVAGVDYSISYKNNKNAWVDKSDERFAKYTGNYNEKNRPKIIITGKGNYATKKEIYFNILPQDITKLVPEESRVLIQKGKSAPAPVIYNNGTKLAAKKDYTLGNSEGNVTVTGTGNYTGSIAYKVIQKSDLKEVSTLKITIDARNLKYEGKAINLLETERLVIKNGNNILDSETIKNNFNISYVGNDRAGKATVVISAKDNNETYYGSVSKTFAISGTDLKEIFKNVSFTEAEKFQGAEYPITFKNMGETNKERFRNASVITYPNSEQPIELKEGVRGHYIATYKNNAKVGTATVTLTGTGKDGVVGKTTLKYNIVAPKTAETPDRVGVYASVVGEVEYTKNGAIPPIEVVYTNGAETKIVLSKGVDYTVAYNKIKIKDVGQTEAVVTFKGNYKGISNWTLYYNVVHRSIKTVSMIAADMEEGKNYKNSLSVTLTDSNGKKLSANSDYKLSYSIDGGEQWYDKLPPVQSVKKANYDNKIQVKAEGIGGYDDEQIFTVHIGAKNYSFGKAKFDKIKKSYTGNEILLSEEEVNKLVTFGSAQEKVPFVGNVENNLATVGISENNQSKDGYYIVSYINNTNKGNMLVVLRGTGKYYGSKTLSIPIQAKTMNDLKNPGNWNWGEQLLNLLK